VPGALETGFFVHHKGVNNGFVRRAVITKIRRCKSLQEGSVRWFWVSQERFSCDPEAARGFQRGKRCSRRNEFIINSLPGPSFRGVSLRGLFKPGLETAWGLGDLCFSLFTS
jgi:hypothetical protein